MPVSHTTRTLVNAPMLKCYVSVILSYFIPFKKNVFSLLLDLGHFIVIVMSTKTKPEGQIYIHNLDLDVDL